MTLAAVILATLWGWSPPTTGSPVVMYQGEVRDAWGAVVLTFATPETTWTCQPWVDHLAHRVRVVGIDADLRVGPPSEWSAPFIPREWARLWMGMGTPLKIPGLLMLAAGMGETVAAWPDSLNRKER